MVKAVKIDDIFKNRNIYSRKNHQTVYQRFQKKILHVVVNMRHVHLYSTYDLGDVQACWTPVFYFCRLSNDLIYWLQMIERRIDINKASNKASRVF